MGTRGMTVDAPLGALLGGCSETPLALVMVIAVVGTRSISDAFNADECARDEARRKVGSHTWMCNDESPLARLLGLGFHSGLGMRRLGSTGRGCGDKRR